MSYDAYQITVTILLGAVGGFAHQIRSDKDRRDLYSYISGCFIAAFMGAIVYFLTVSLGIDPNFSCALSGICGWTGPQAMDAISDLAAKKLGFGLTEIGGK